MAFDRLWGWHRGTWTKRADVLAHEWDQLDLPDLRDKTVLDIGAWDGWFSFQAERCGAKRVVALEPLPNPSTNKLELVPLAAPDPTGKGSDGCHDREDRQGDEHEQHIARRSERRRDTESDDGY